MALFTNCVVSFAAKRMEQSLENRPAAFHGRLPVRREISRPAEPETQPKPVADPDLMRRTQGGDAEAFAEIYRRYAAPVLSYLYRFLGAKEDVEAIAQEVFLRAYRFRATYRYPERLNTWLFAIARNLAINQSRRRKRDPVRNVTELHLEGIEIGSQPAPAAAGVAVAAEQKEEIVRMMAALDQLPPDQKETIVLGIFQDLSYAEMETITGVKAVTLRSRMFHGLRRLSALMGGRGV